MRFNFKAISELINYFTKRRYTNGLGGLSSENIWELKQQAQDDADRKAIDEGRALVPKNVEINKTVQSEKIETAFSLKKKSE